MSTIFTQATKSYLTTFQGFEKQFMIWGTDLFFGLLGINLVMLGIWCAFDKSGFPEALSEFLKKFFIATVFYTILLHPEWLHSALDGASSMGETLAKHPLDPSNIVSQGIGMANLILTPIKSMSFFKMGIGMFLGLVAYLSVLYVFITIALEVVQALVISSALITVSCFLLGFGGFSVTQAIARQAIDAVIGYCVKLLGFYMVITAGLTTMDIMKGKIPATADAVIAVGFDDYAWVLAAAWIFYGIAKTLPSQMAKIVSGGIQESRGTEMAAIVLSATRAMTNSISPQKGSPASLAGQALSKIASAAVSMTGVGALGSLAMSAAKHAAGAVKNAVTGGGSSGGGGNATPGNDGAKPRSVPK